MASAQAKAELNVNGKTWTVATADQLRRRLKAVRTTPFAEVWLRRHDKTSMAVFVNRRAAWMTYFRYDGDGGFSSRNPDYVGPGDAMMQFLLANGQMDEYPVRWTYPTGKTLLALEYFFRTGERSPKVTWEED